MVAGSCEPAANEQPGLGTAEALQRLHDDIESMLRGYEERYRRQHWAEKVRSSLVGSSTSPLGWFPVLASLLCALSLTVTGYYWSAGLLLVLLLLTIALVVRENNLRRTEIYRKLRTVLHEIRLGVRLCPDWTVDNYPHLCSPLSPCVTLQWTYRDGRIVNLPWALLVRGDHIVMRPGQVSPGTCREVGGRGRRFKCGETYGLQQPTEPPVKPIARSPLPDLVCAVEATPYLDILRKSLDCFLDRPKTIINQQRELLVSRCLQRWGFGLILFLTVSIGILRNVGLYLQGKLPTNWMNVFLLNPTAAVLPLLPLVFPLLWVAINLWGVARLETLLSIPQAVMRAQAQKSFAEDLDTPTCDLDHVKLPRRTVFFYWWQLLKGRSELLGRSASVVQVLGTITALCCVDKKGILSWPNPTAEKVFFLRNAREGDHNTDQSEQSSLNSQCCQEHYHPLSHIIELSSQKEPLGAIAEVLDLTHDQHSPFKLEFDDHDFKNHLTSLKPLGIAILVNTCCPLTQAHYAKFCGHVTAAAMLDKDLVPVTNRYAIVESSLNCFMHGRCLCELAKQIGFSPQARDIFQLEGQISSYRHLQPDVVRRDIRFARSLQLATKVKVPFPHSLSVVMREINNGSLQLLTQGTADIVLDCCDDYWDGHDLQPLTEKERKRAQDFYQRSALTAYCTAFAYRPLRHGISGALSGGPKAGGSVAYLELPPETKHRRDLYRRENYSDLVVTGGGGTTGHQSLIGGYVDDGADGGGGGGSTIAGTAGPRGGSVAPLAHHSISTDSLLFNDSRDDDISDVDGCYRMQCHQVFIGMVTMQYQAQTDIVQLIERLERACIRFVHFSKENELRSRVFSEKMGLESGWNCHISLLSDGDSRSSSPARGECGESGTGVEPFEGGPERVRLLDVPLSLESSRALSSSAPCAISNPDTNSLLEPGQGAPGRTSPAPSERSSSGGGGEDQDPKHGKAVSVGGHCRSLSCLTDSTEQSAPINFDMSNRAKLPRGIENIRPHLEHVDNVPLLVSLFTDCSAEATREMLNIMQQYGEIVVCLGSSASNSNSEIFLQGDCSIAIEPLYPQVCQEYPAYSESNIYNNRARLRPDAGGASDENQQQKERWEGPLPDRCNTISPVYLSRILNSISCSIATCRDDPISIVAVIELSRRFMAGLWSCVQYWACCGASLAIMNTVTAILSLPPMVVPLHALYLMCIVVPLVALTLLRVEPDPALMKRATGKKQKTLSSRLVLFVLWCYGIKFALAILVLVLAYCTFLSHPIELFAGGGGGGGAGSLADAPSAGTTRAVVQRDAAETERALAGDLHVARSFILLGIVLHFVTISASFVHRDYNCFKRSPLTNLCWVSVVALLLLVHLGLAVLQLCTDDHLWREMERVWPIVLGIVLTVLVTFAASEFFKWEEIKVNNRYIRRARLDFGTKLGMNSPF
ncbi:transmembrane protein 94 isoform X1 [Anopheles arabiensis]|uniref:transmembrane protein 94 isoform X1 n=1 Tax=Anopheles arabiensis TaxID=7173 RepID=UPI001AAC7408|nr:transmembrane protein 94 isoform X1 [Anopheles arabiensis]XP_040173076.1 transmembrane protein 94 isoform X1 [Anopheles arabiensis]XP_040173077.1 transmembrane protein 94 isoform X1 [Anopheles arabiensis]